MARFCEYCGRRIDDGECDCPEAVAAREREAREKKAEAVTTGASADCQTDDGVAGGQEGVIAGDQAQDASNIYEGNSAAPEAAAAAQDNAATSANDAAEPSNTAYDSLNVDSSVAGADSRSRVSEVLGTTGAEVALDLKDLFAGMFTAPVETLRENAKRKDHTSSYIIAAILSVLVFIIIAIVGDNPLVNQAIGRGTLVVFALSAAVAIFLFKAVYAACITLWGKKYDPELTYSSALATFCLLGIYDLVMLLAFTFFTALSIFELSIAILFFWLIVTAVSGIIASWILTDGKADSVIRFNLVLLFIFIVLIVLSLRGIVLDMFAGAVMVIMNTLAGF